MAVDETVGRYPDLAIATPSSVTRTPALSALSVELLLYALAIAPKIVSAIDGVDVNKNVDNSSALSLPFEINIINLCNSSHAEPIGSVRGNVGRSPSRNQAKRFGRTASKGRATRRPEHLP